MGHIACAVVGLLAGLLIAALLGMAHEEKARDEKWAVFHKGFDYGYRAGMKDGRAGDM